MTRDPSIASLEKSVDGLSIEQLREIAGGLDGYKKDLERVTRRVAKRLRADDARLRDERAAQYPGIFIEPATRAAHDRAPLLTAEVVADLDRLKALMTGQWVTTGFEAGRGCNQIAVQCDLKDFLSGAIGDWRRWTLGGPTLEAPNRWAVEIYEPNVGVSCFLFWAPARHDFLAALARQAAARAEGKAALVERRKVSP